MSKIINKICENCKNSEICKYKKQLEDSIDKANTNTDFSDELPIEITVTCKYKELVKYPYIPSNLRGLDTVNPTKITCDTSSLHPSRDIIKNGFDK